MPSIKVDQSLQDAVEKAARDRGCSPAELIASLLEAHGEPPTNNPLLAYTRSAEFRAKFTDAEKYLGLLAWVAKTHASEFSDFIEHLASGRRYLSLSPEAIRATCSHNQAREVPGTRYWAIMNLDTPTKRRFLRRLLVFVGYTDDVIGEVASAFGRRAA